MTIYVNIMVDTISIYLDLTIANFGNINLLGRRLIIDASTREITGIEGYLRGNLRVRYNLGRLNISGSLAKFYFGNNVRILHHSETVDAIKQIESNLDVALTNARITRLDFADNMEVAIPVKQCFPFFGASRYYERFMNKNTLYYNSNARKKTFYDKGLESNLGSGVNVLRFEVRWLGKYLNYKFKKEAGLQCFQVQHLLNPITYNYLVRLWQEEFDSIQKNSFGVFDLTKCTTPKQIEQQLVLAGIEFLGGINELTNSIKLSIAKNPLPYPEMHSRINKNLRKFSLLNNHYSDYPFIKELEKIMHRKVNFNLASLH